MKKFIITIDTEGDNLWEWDGKSPITTKNTEYLPRFQELCDSYGFKPVWLTNFEMISDPKFADFIAKVESEKRGELGMHLHAWNTPPQYELVNETGENPYLIEYPETIMEEKIACMTSLLKERTGVTPITHRAGRWAIDNRYVSLLIKYGYRVDCSVTPHIDWRGHSGASKPGADYRLHSENPTFLDERKTLLEVPVTIRQSHALFKPAKAAPRKLAGAVLHALQGQNIWARPMQSLEVQIHYLIERIAKEPQTDYIMFMLHSSELMPGGSPRFKTKESIDTLYLEMERIFAHAATDFEGCTLRDYRKLMQRK